MLFHTAVGLARRHGNYPTIWAYKNATTAIGRATMRKDGWWSYDADSNSEQELVTTLQRLPSAPASLFVNVVTSVRGSLRVEALDAMTLQPLPGLSINDSVPLMGNYVRQRVSWASGVGLPAARGVRLRFVAMAAKLYSFELASSMGA